MLLTKDLLLVESPLPSVNIQYEQANHRDREEKLVLSWVRVRVREVNQVFSEKNTTENDITAKVVLPNGMLKIKRLCMILQF